MSGRGLELTFPLSDIVTLPNARRINVTLRAGPDIDELRIITLCDTPAPEVTEAPLVMLLPLSGAVIGGAVFILRRRSPARV